MTDKLIEHLEREYEKPLKDILVQMYQEERNQRAVASRLGVTQNTVWRWMKFCGLEIVTENRLIERS